MAPVVNVRNVPNLVLASASPARLTTLRNAGLDPTVIISGVDESQADGLPPFEMALQLAELKCAAVADRDGVPEGALVLGCDSVLDLDGEPLGKPGTPEEATRRWRSMRAPDNLDSSPALARLAQCAFGDALALVTA